MDIADRRKLGNAIVLLKQVRDNCDAGQDLCQTCGKMRSRDSTDYVRFEILSAAMSRIQKVIDGAKNDVEVV